MCWARTSVMVAVVQCASSVGGSPRLPTFRTPPFFWAKVSGALTVINAIDASASSEARTVDLDGTVSLPRVSGPNLAHETARGACPSARRATAAVRWRAEAVRTTGWHPGTLAASVRTIDGTRA